jgi:metallo-beta-lactamase family protein
MDEHEGKSPSPRGHSRTGTRTLRFLGATNTVTGSKTLFHAGPARVLVDCGLFQGYKQLRLRNWASLPFAPGDLEAVILTHAHIDHSGYLPLLVKKGYRGRVYCSEGTRDLARVMLPDAGRLQEEEAEYANRHEFSKHKPALPLYTEADAKRALKQLHPVPFGARVELDGIAFTLCPGGHILGASIVVLEHRDERIVFSGDLGRMNDVLMKPPALVSAADYLVVESTYGNRHHEASDPGVALAKAINETIARRGVVVIPAFAVGRTQTLLHMIGELKQSESIPSDLPVFLNSPMGADATDAYLHYCNRHPGEHRLTARQRQALGRVAVNVKSTEESRRLNQREGPMVIIAGSGMATGGRVVHHLKSFLPDPRNTVLFAGFQACGTRGAALVAGAEAIKIHGDYVPARANVVMIENLSAHADATEILQWLRGFEHAPRETFINHGEPGAADALRQKIEETLGWKCRVPDYLENVVLE